MTATDELRRLLDERGVEHYDGCETTLWLKEAGRGFRVEATELGADERGDVTFSVHMWCDTPEQAIAATLGPGTCRDLCIGDPRYEVFGDKTGFKCSECGGEYSSVGGYGCDFGDSPYFDYCPFCGRKVVDE